MYTHFQQLKIYIGFCQLHTLICTIDLRYVFGTDRQVNQDRQEGKYSLGFK